MDLEAQKMDLVSVCVWCLRSKALCHGRHFIGVKLMFLEFKKYVTREAYTARAVSAFFCICVSSFHALRIVYFYLMREH